MFNTIDYMRGIVGSMTFNQAISNINYDAVNKTTTFDTCKTYWVFPCYIINIGGVDYEVVTSEVNMSITVKEEVPITETEYSIAAPKFFHGTPMQATIEMGAESDWLDKLPFVYIIEPMKEVRDLRPLRVLERTSELEILFMLPAELEEPLDLQVETAIKPADNMVWEFENKVMRDPNIADLEKAESRNRINYGVWVLRKDKNKPSKPDNMRRLLPEAISGIDYAIKIPFKRSVCDINARCKN